MSDSKPKAAPDLQALLSLTQQTAQQSKTRLAMFVVLVLGVIGVIAFGTVYVIKKMNTAQAEKEAASQLQDAARSANASMVCPNGQKAITCNGAMICGPLCLPSQTLSCSGSTGAYTATCVCKGGFKKVEGCQGCVPASCATGLGVCPDEGVCECKAPVTSCKIAPSIDPRSGEFSGEIPSPTCPQKCVNLYEATQPGNTNATGRAGAIAKANELCRAQTCEYDPAQPFDTYPECSAPGSKFDGYNPTLGKCFKTVNCGSRVDEGWTASVGPNTVSNLGVIYKKQAENNTCRSLTINEVGDLCLNDANGCPFGYTYVPSTGTTGGTGPDAYKPAECRSASGSVTGPRGPGVRPTGTKKDWDGNTCWNGQPSYLLHNSIIECQSIFTVNTVTGEMQGRTVVKGYVAIPKTLLSMNAFNWMLQFEARECTVTNDGAIKLNGHRGGCDMTAVAFTPTTQSSIVDLPNPDNYQIYEVFGIIDNFLRSTDANWPGSGLTVSSVPYRCYFGFLVQTDQANGAWQLVSISKEADPASDCLAVASNNVINKCGLPISVAMSKTGVTNFIPAPGLTRVGVTALLEANNVNMLQSSMNNPYATETTSLAANPSQAMFAGNFQTPYVIASCSPDYCPATKLANTQVLVLGISMKPLPGQASWQPPANHRAAFVIRRYQIDPAQPSKPWATFVGQSVQIASVIIGSTNSSGLFTKRDGIITAAVDPANPTHTTYVLADYVTANQTYVYQIAAYWWSPTEFQYDPDPTDPAKSPDIRYAEALKVNKATLFRYQIVRTPPYTKESCWAMTFNGQGNLPNHYVYDPVKSYCVPPNLFAPGGTNPLSPDSAYDFNYNFEERKAFDSIDKSNIKLYDSLRPQTISYNVPLAEAHTYSTSTGMFNNPTMWQQDGDAWINPQSGKVTVQCPRKVTLNSGTEIVISNDWRTTAEKANTATGAFAEHGTLYGRLQDMDRFGRRFVPGYVGPSNTALLSYVDALKPDRTDGCSWIDLREARNNDNILTNVQNLAMKGYTSNNSQAALLNTVIVDNLRASNKAQFPSIYSNNEAMARYPNWVDQFQPISLDGDKIVSSADYLYIKPLLPATGTLTPSQQADITKQTNSLLQKGPTTQFPCNIRPYRIHNIGTETMKACCDCMASFTNPTSSVCPVPR